MPGRPESAALQTAIDNNATIGTKLITRMAAEIPPEMVIEVIKGLMTAKQWVRVSKTETREVDDHARRESGARLFIAYMVGMPIQRVVEVHQKPESDAEVMDRLLSSPTAREEFRKLLDEAEARNTSTNPAEVVDMPPG